MSLAALFAPHGVSRAFRPILRTLREAAREVGSADLERDALTLLSEWEVRGAASARAREGAVEAVSTLAGAGVAPAVVPALHAAGLDPVRFTSIVTRDDVPIGKPDPAAVRKAAEELRAAPTWYVVDHQQDIDTGKAAGLRVVAVLGGLRAIRGADVAVASLRDLPRLVLA